METVVWSILFGFFVSVATALILGIEKANRLPGGAIASGFSVALFQGEPILIGCVSGFIGFLIFVGIAGSMGKNKFSGD